MKNNYLEKRRMAIRRRRSTFTEKTVNGKNLMITDACESKMKKLTIKGVNRQAYSAQPICPEYPREILSSDSFNLVLNNNFKNEITDEYIERLLTEEWTRHYNPNGNQTNYFRSPKLYLKPNTTYTLYRASKENRTGIYKVLIQPWAIFPYGGIGYNKTAETNSDYGLSSWLWHGEGAGSNRKYHTFTTDDTGEVWFSVSDTRVQYWLNGIETNGLIIVKGNYTQAEMEQNIINIPKTLTLDDNTTVDLQLWNVFNTSNENCIYDSIDVDYETGKATYTKKICECVMDGQKAGHNRYGYGALINCSNNMYSLNILQQYIYMSTIPAGLTNSADLAFTPICNQATGRSSNVIYNYSNSNYYYQVKNGVLGDYAGSTQYIVPKAVIDAYTGWYTCHLQELSVPTGATGYFTITIDDVATSYSFTVPIDMGEFTSVKFNPESVKLLVNEEEVEVATIESVPEDGIILTFESLDDDVTYYGETKVGWRKNWQYFKDRAAIGEPVIFRFPVAESKRVTTDITNSDLGRQLLALRLKQNNTISTDNWYCNEIEITYKAR